MCIMRVKDIVDHFGSIEAVARFFSISRDSVYKWGEFIPAHRQYELEVKTRGLLKSDYSIQREKNNEKNYKKKYDRRVSDAR